MVSCFDIGSAPLKRSGKLSSVRGPRVNRETPQSVVQLDLKFREEGCHREPPYRYHLTKHTVQPKILEAERLQKAKARI